MAALGVSPNFGYVLATLTGSVLVHHVWINGKIMKARKQYGVKYPHLYAPADNKNKHEFDCVQRAVSHSFDNLTTHLTLLVTCGLRFPIASSIAGIVYLVGRIRYVKGYCTGNPEARYQGSILYLGTLSHLVMAMVWATELLKPQFF